MVTGYPDLRRCLFQKGAGCGDKSESGVNIYKSGRGRRPSWTALLMPHSAVLIRVVAWVLLFVSMAAARPVHTISRFICVGCEREGQFCRLFPTRRAASIHVGKSPSCRKLGLGVREIMVGAGTGTDVLAGGAGAAGPAPDVRHQPPGIRGLGKRISQSETTYFGISKPNFRISKKNTNLKKIN